MKRAKAVFLDRDGTIIEHVHYINDPKKVKLCENAARGLKALQEKGYLLFVVSNQSGVARGLITEQQFQAVHRKFCDLLEADQITIADFGYCFHHPQDECDCRKPKTALIPEKHLGQTLDLKKSFVIGDNESDLLLAKNFGGTAYLILTGDGTKTLEQLKAKGEAGKYAIGKDLYSIALEIPPA